MGCRLVQVPGAQHFRLEHAQHAFGVQLRDKAVVKHHCAVEHAGKRHAILGDAPNDRVDIGAPRDVGRYGVRLDPAFAEFGDQAPCLRLRVT